MFRKLISNLPFQPTLLADVAYYAHRLKQENSIRRLGFLLLLIGFGLQIFIVAFPPQASLATNTSDIIYGATNKQDVLTAYKNNRDQLGRKDIQALFNYYGIGESQIEKATTTIIKDNGTDYINTSRSTTKYADTYVKIPGVVDGGIYEFPLSYWRKNEYPNGYPALTGVSEYGFRFWILLKGCGNIVYEKGAKKPQLEIKKTLTTGSTATLGKTISYNITFRNTGAVAAKTTKIVDTLSNGLTYVSHTSTLDVDLKINDSTLTWSINNKDGALAPGTRWHQITLVVSPDVVSSKKICNSVVITASNASKSESTDGACVTVKEQTCPGTGLPIPAGGIEACVIQCPDGSQLPYSQTCAVPQLSCSDLEITTTDLWNSRIFTTTVTTQPGGTVKEVVYYINNTKAGSVSSPNDQGKYTYNHIFINEGEYTVRSEVIASKGIVQASQGCVKIEEVVTPDTPEAILVTDKKVKNDTQNIDDANNTEANASDMLTYNLLITNKGSGIAKDVDLNGEYAEDVRDILEYADIINLNDGALNKDTGKITWPAVTINPGVTIVKAFTVKVKDPLPATPISTSNPLSFDFEMHNKYGRTVVIKLKKPASKTIEQAVTVLPNTGPTSSLIISALLVSIIAYFYYRNKLLSKELLIIQDEFKTGGL